MGAPLAYFSPTGKVGKSVLKKTRNGFLENLSLFFVFILRSPCGWFGLNRTGVRVWDIAATRICPQGDPAAAQVPPLWAAEPDIGCVGRFVLVLVLVAPFHYAIDRWFYSWEKDTDFCFGQHSKSGFNEV